MTVNWHCKKYYNHYVAFDTTSNTKLLLLNLTIYTLTLELNIKHANSWYTMARSNVKYSCPVSLVV